MEIFTQFVGFVAVGFSIAVFQKNKRRTMLILASIAAFFYAGHFFFLEAYTGAAMNLLGAVRCLIFLKVSPQKANIWILYLFLGLGFIATIVTWQSWYSLLSLLGASLYAISTWQSTPKMIRRFSLAAPPFWFSYNALAGSYPGMLIEVLIFASIILGRYRFDRSVTKK